MYRLIRLGCILSLLFMKMEVMASLEYLHDFRFSGDLDGDGQDELVQLFWNNPSGSGTVVYLNLIILDQQGKPRSLVQLVGDRVQVMDARIEEGAIRLEVVQPGEIPSICCGSRKWLRRWRLEGSKLVEMPPEGKGAVAVEDLEGRAWRLQALGDYILESEPEITLVFAEEQIRGNSGCNHYFAEVRAASEQGVGGMATGPLGSTRKACSTAIMEMEQKYLEALRQVVRFSLVGSELHLYWKGEDGEGVLRFVEATSQPRKGK